MEAIKNDKITRYLIVVTVLVGCCAGAIWLSVLGRSRQSAPLPPQTSLPVIEKTLAPTTSPPTDVQAYGLEISQETKRLGEALADLQSLTLNPRLDDQDWINQVALAVTVVRLSHERITKINPPPEMVNIHSFVLDATRDCDRSMDFLVDGIDNHNTDSMKKATELILSCGEKSNRAVQAMNEYNP